MLRYTLRISPELTNTETDLLFPIFQLSGPGYAGASKGQHNLLLDSTKDQYGPESNS
jgi:hypothetical protein